MQRITIDLKNIRAAIFDMDGTMINNMLYHKKAWREFSSRYGLSLTDEEFSKKISGKKNDQIFEFVFGRKLKPDGLEKYIEEKEAIYRELYKPEIREVEGLTQTINTLRKKNIKLAIATTAPQKNREFGLEALHLNGQFDIILGDENVTHGKPDPEIYLETAKRLQVKTRNCLVFEDSPSGVESSKNAGMIVIGLLTSHSKEDLHKADYVVNDFTELELV
jgi:HAD superfamily hydrolase (TIGR01509 family)